MARCNGVRLAAAVLTLATACANWVYAQAYPTKPVRIVTTGIGGPSDLVSRIIAPEISGSLGQQVIVENRASNILAESVARAPADGYALMITTGALWTAPLLQTTAYDPIRDFLPISLLTTQPSLVLVHPSLPVKTVRQLIDLAKARPGQLNYAAAGTGGTSHLAAELLKSMAKVNIVGIFYSSNASQLAALLSGEVQMNIGNAGTAQRLVNSGKLKALAVTSAQRTALVPGMPTVAETGVPGYEVGSINGLFAPAKTPDAVIRRMNDEVTRALTRPDMKDKLFALGAEVVASPPERLAAVMKSDMARMEKVISDAKIRLER